MKRHQALENLVAPTIVGLGYEFVGLEYLAHSKSSIVRIYIDRPGGVTINDCEKVSRQVAAVLDVESQFARGAYNLEVSSPGVERKIFTPEQFPRFIGDKLRISLGTPLDGRRNFTGVLREVGDSELMLDVSGEIVKIDFVNVAQANVIEQARL